MSNDPSPGDMFRWGIPAIILFIFFLIALSATGALGNIFGITVNRKAVEQSVQYSEANIDAFYTRLEAVKKIDVQIAGLDPSDPQVAALRSQKSLLESEMRRDVAKLPSDARTSDMYPYGSR